MSLPYSYVLEELDADFNWKIVGVISSSGTAYKFYNKNKLHRRITEIYVNDPELLNRIAKESESKNASS